MIELFCEMKNFVKQALDEPGSHGFDHTLRVVSLCHIIGKAEQAEMDIKDGFIDAVTYLEIDQEYRSAARQLDEAKLQKLLLQAQLQVALGLPVYKNE